MDTLDAMEALTHMGDVLPWSEEAAYHLAVMIRTFRGGRTVVEFANDLGIAPGYITRAEKGSIALTVGQVAYFASAAGISAAGNKTQDKAGTTLADVMGPMAFGPLKSEGIPVPEALALKIRKELSEIERRLSSGQ